MQQYLVRPCHKHSPKSSLHPTYSGSRKHNAAIVQTKRYNNAATNLVPPYHKRSTLSHDNHLHLQRHWNK